MSTWPETEPEVNLHDVISRTSVTNVSRFQRLYDIEPDLVQSSRNRQPSWRNLPNLLIQKIQDGGGRHIEFRKISISPDWMSTDWMSIFAVEICSSNPETLRHWGKIKYPNIKIAISQKCLNIFTPNFAHLFATILCTNVLLCAVLTWHMSTWRKRKLQERIFQLNKKLILLLK